MARDTAAIRNVIKWCQDTALDVARNRPSDPKRVGPQYLKELEVRLIAAGVGEIVERMRPRRWSSIESIIANLSSNARKLEAILEECEEGEWSAPMSRAEMARRIMEDPKARWRGAEPLVKQYEMREVDNKLCIRLDNMDSKMRRKLEEPR